MNTAWVFVPVSVLAAGGAVAQMPPRPVFVPQLALNEAASPSGFGSAWNVAGVERSWEFVVIHHSATTSGSVESIHREHRQRKDRNGQPWLGIGYHFVIGNGFGMPDGEISSTFRWRDQIHGAHSGSIRHNASGIGICLIGNFEYSKPTAAQKESIVRLIAYLIDRYQISSRRIIGHRHIRETACPGRHFPLGSIVQESLRLAETPEHSGRPD